MSQFLRMIQELLLLIIRNKNKSILDITLTCETHKVCFGDSRVCRAQLQKLALSSNSGFNVVTLVAALDRSHYQQNYSVTLLH